MKAQLIILGLISVLTACAGPTDRGQQYQDGTLPAMLNPVATIHSNVPRNFDGFVRQSQLVTENSPSLANTYQPLYHQLEQWVLDSGNPADLSKYHIQAAQFGGVNHHGNVLFTGYFSPVVELHHQRDAQYRYPVYAMPDCQKDCPTRAQIYSGALAGQGLELGYANNLIDPFIMEVQGSGFVHFADDDSLAYFAYAGKNNQPYKSIGKILIENGEIPKAKMSLKAIKHWVASQDATTVRRLLEANPSYVFFTPRPTNEVMGTAGIPLLPMAAVAGDKHWLPMGTPLLAEVPLLNADGTWSGTYQLRLLIVLDTGGAVTDNHLDVYHGMGTRAGIDAGHYRHFGRVWKLGLQGSATQTPWVTPPEKMPN